jgi:prolyl-tRNA editing enzyme YbaK/EbsC (Cys-tRNA(Pro) deacylase)
VTVQSVQAFLDAHAPDIRIIELETSTATVALAAAAHGVEPAQIAKTLSLRVGERCLLVVAAGTARLDNKKARTAFGGKVRMLDAAEVEAVTGHPVGGVCPFGAADGLAIYCDVSLKAFTEVVPAAGSTHSALRIDPLRMATLVNATWVDVCQDTTIARQDGVAVT